MDLQKINGNSYAIMAPTNIGIYSFKNKNCIIIDTGIDNTSGKKIDEVLIENGLHPKFIINTHSHIDHCGGNNYLRDKYTGILAYSSCDEELLMTHGELNSEVLYSAANCFSSLDKANIRHAFEAPLIEGENKIGDEKFQVMILPGHSKGTLALITGDKVCYLGDSIFSKEILEKYKIPNLINVKGQLTSLNRIKEIDCDYFVIGHSSEIYSKEEIILLVDYNLSIIDEVGNVIFELLSEPQSRETLIENLCILKDLSINFKEYYLMNQTIGAYLSLFYERGQITYSVQDGRLYYYRKES